MAFEPSSWLSFFSGYEGALTTLLFAVAAITLYEIFVYAFYRSLSLRMWFGRRGPRPTPWGALGRALATLFLYPLLTFGYFLLLSAALFLLVKPSTPTSQILLISISLVASVRVTAYFSEEASVDLAKLVPLALLGVFIVDPGLTSPSSVLSRFSDLWTLRDLALRYFVVLLLLEIVLKGVFLVSRRLWGGRVEFTRAKG